MHSSLFIRYSTKTLNIPIKFTFLLFPSPIWMQIFVAQNSAFILNVHAQKLRVQILACMRVALKTWKFFSHPAFYLLCLWREKGKGYVYILSFSLPSFFLFSLFLCVFCGETMSHFMRRPLVGDFKQQRLVFSLRGIFKGIKIID